MKPIFLVIHGIVLLLILAFTVLPMISVAIAGSIAAANGCVR